jgi:hypothetical protein
MDATGHRNAVWHDHREFHAMFIHLGQLRWGGNGEGKRAWGLPIALGPGQLFALLSHLWFLVEGSYRGSDLIVGRKREGGAWSSCRSETVRLSSACSRSRSSIWLQKGYHVGRMSPVFQLGIHPEMLSPAMREQVDATHANLRHDMTSLFDITRLSRTLRDADDPRELSVASHSVGR